MPLIRCQIRWPLIVWLRWPLHISAAIRRWLAIISPALAFAAFRYCARCHWYAADADIDWYWPLRRHWRHFSLMPPRWVIIDDAITLMLRCFSWLLQLAAAPRWCHYWYCHYCWSPYIIAVWWPCRHYYWLMPLLLRCYASWACHYFSYCWLTPLRLRPSPPFSISCRFRFRRLPLYYGFSARVDTTITDDAPPAAYFALVILRIAAVRHYVDAACRQRLDAVSLMLDAADVAACPSFRWLIVIAIAVIAFIDTATIISLLILATLLILITAWV